MAGIETDKKMTIYNHSFFQDLFCAEKENWWYRGREKIIVDLLRKTFKDRFRKKKILDLGCGTGRMMVVLRDFGQVSGADISDEAITFCQKQGFQNLKKIDAEKSLPFPNETFDLITAFDLLEHLKNDQKILLEINRLLRPQGLLLVTVPALPVLWSKHDEAFGHQRRYLKKDLILKVQKTNFQVIRLTYFNFFLLPGIFLGGRLVNLLFKSKHRSHILKLPSFLNWLVTQIYFAEGFIASKFNMPLGSSLLCLAQKIDKNERNN